MRPKFNKKYINIGIVAFGVVVFSIIFFFVCFHMKELKLGIANLLSILKPIIYGFIIAYLFTPIIDYIERNILYPIHLNKHDSISLKRRKLYRIISIILSILIVILIFSILLRSIIPQFVESVKSLTTQLPIYYDSIIQWINSLIENNANLLSAAEDFININNIDLSLNNIFKYFSDNILNNVLNGLVNVSGIVILVLKNLWNFVIGLIVSIYVMLNKEIFCAQAKKICYALFSRERSNLIIKDTRFISDTFIGFLGGKIIDSIIIFILCLIGLSILKTPYAVLISVIIGVTNIIPFFGPFIGAIPSALLVLMVDPLKCISFIIFVLILQQVDGNIIGPLILGDSTGISGFWVIFSITVFGSLWGIVGMIIGIPVFAVIYAIFKRNIERKLKNKDLPVSTNEYKKIKSIDENGDIIELFEANDLNFKKEKKNLKEKKEDIINIIKKNNDEEDNNIEEK